MADPCRKALITPTTMPKQWNSGTGRQIRSSGRRPMRAPICSALLTRFACASVAPFGAPVVPEVYW